MNEEGLELSVPVGVSGAFLRDKNRFGQIRAKWAEFVSLRSRLLETEHKLSLFHNPEWLAAFEQQCQRLKRNPELALPGEADRLEKQKRELENKRDETRRRLLELEPRAFDVQQTLAGGFFPYLEGHARRIDDRAANLEVKTRNQAIDRLLHLSNMGICKELDDTFPCLDRPAPQFPDSWYERFGVKTFQEAYQHKDKKCRHLVHVMIWKRRKLRRSLGS